MSKFFAAAAVAGGLLAVASPASAVTVANFGPPPSEGAVVKIDWTKTGALTGTLSANSIVEFDFGNVFGHLFPLWDISANFLLNGTVSGTPAVAGAFQAEVDNGSFSFTYHDTDTSSAVDNYGGYLLSDGALLFGGTFNDAMIVRAPNTATVLSTTSVTFFSPYFSVVPGTGQFALSVTEVTPGNTTVPGHVLSSFTGDSTGIFSAAVPEPGTWALMIIGFGGAGAMLRSRRRTAMITA